MSSTNKNTKWARRLRYSLILKGMAVGAAVGVVVSLFRYLLMAAEPLRWQLLEYAASLGEIYDVVVENMERQEQGLKG